ncbi:MAG: DUF6580 family putative transport protein [Candidatus Andersenbacteria bacterium]
MRLSQFYTFLLMISLVIFSVAARVSEHIPNVAPIAALALVAGSMVSVPLALALPLVAMFISDTMIGFDQIEITVAVYSCFGLIALLGHLLHGSFRPWRTIGVTVISSVLFYLVTNAAVWWWSGMYARTLDGLILSYLYALPFFRNTLFGDMIFTFSLFLAIQYVPGLLGARLSAKQAWQTPVTTGTPLPPPAESHN